MDLRASVGSEGQWEVGDHCGGSEGHCGGRESLGGGI